MVEIKDFKMVSKNYKGVNVIKIDACKKPTVALISNGATMIPLCEDCFRKFKKEIENIKIEVGNE